MMLQPTASPEAPATDVRPLDALAVGIPASIDPRSSVSPPKGSRATDPPAPGARSARGLLLVRRGLLAVLVLVTTVVGTLHMHAVLAINEMNPFKWGVLALFCLLFTPLALAFWTAVLGFMMPLTPGDRLAITRVLSAPSPPGLLTKRTAVVMPIRNEDTARVMAGVAVMYESLRKTGRLEHFDFWVLSDTSDTEVWI